VIVTFVWHQLFGHSVRQLGIVGFRTCAAEEHFDFQMVWTIAFRKADRRQYQISQFAQVLALLKHELQYMHTIAFLFCFAPGLVEQIRRQWYRLIGKSDSTKVRKMQ